MDKLNKQLLLPTPGSGTSSKTSKSSNTRLVLFLAGSLLLLQTYLAAPQLSVSLSRLFAPPSNAPSATGIGSGIAWFACPDLTEFECGFLSVPMSYLNPVPGETVSLALRRYPSTAPKSEYRGTVFTNPGGPGGSGTAYLVERGPALSKILGGKYDILSWDPRGVNMTTPPLGCYPTDYAEFLQELKQTQLGLPMSQHSPSSGNHTPAQAAATQPEKKWFLRTESYYRATVASCHSNGNHKLLASVSTPFVARDIVSILQALGPEEYSRGLQYWGFSYGTILGATFSAMFPELVHRVVLDGVSDAKLYGNDMYTWGRSGMNDTHLVWEGFLSECAQAGGERCALAAGGKTAGEIERDVWELEERLIKRRMPVGWTGMNSGVLTAGDVRFAIFQSLYRPLLWHHLALALHLAITGDGSAIMDMIGFQSHSEMSWKDPEDNVFGRYMTRALSKPVGNPLSTEAIMCSDTSRSTLLPANSSVPSTAFFQQWSKELGEQSPTGEQWAKWIGRCRWWDFEAEEVYRGPWSRGEGLRKTKFPVVFISMTADPVTPLSAAISMQAGFTNDSSTLVINNGYGHCSYAHPSMCIAKTLRAYFDDGIVPEYGTTCSSDPGQLFPSSSSISNAADAQAADGEIRLMSKEDQQMWEALHLLGTAEVGGWL